MLRQVLCASVCLAPLILTLALAALPLARAACTPISVAGHFRRDYFLPYSVFPEDHLPDPVDGGRVHMVASLPGDVALPLVSVTVNGVDALNLDYNSTADLTFFDWARPSFNAATGQFALSFHSQNTDWLPAVLSDSTTLALGLADSAGACYAGSLAVRQSNLSVTWITPLLDAPTSISYASDWIVHVENAYADGVACELGELEFDGQSVGQSARLPVVLGPQSHAVLVFTPSTSKMRGEQFTLVLSGQCDGEVFALAYGARVPEARFAIESWPEASTCPLPGHDQAAYESVSSVGFDTFFFPAAAYAGQCGGGSLADAIEQLGPANGVYWYTDYFGLFNLSAAALPFVVGFTEDEPDGPFDNVRPLLLQSLLIETASPYVLSYSGGKTNRYNGAFAGVTDIQGLDAYIAGCAPTMVDVTAKLPLQTSYAYLRNARNNHMPLQTAFYTQLFDPHTWITQPNGNELMLSIGSVLLAGGKGLTAFLTDYAIATSQGAAAWNGAVGSAVRSIANAQVRHVLRTGDIDSLPLLTSDPDANYEAASLAQVIRNDNSILIVVVNFNAHGYSNLLCHVHVGEHWTFEAHTLAQLVLSLTPDVALESVDPMLLVEIINGTAVAPAEGSLVVSLDAAERALTLADVQLTADSPLRLFMIPYALANGASRPAGHMGLAV